MQQNFSLGDNKEWQNYKVVKALTIQPLMHNKSELQNGSIVTHKNGSDKICGVFMFSTIKVKVNFFLPHRILSNNCNNIQT